MPTNPLAQVDDIINNMNKINMCDADCVRKKKVSRLKTQLNNATNTYNNGPNQIKELTKSYYLEDPTKGAQYYNNYIETEFKAKAQTEVDDWNITLINPLVNTINNKINYYKTQEYYSNNVNDLYDYHTTNIEDLKQKKEDTNAKKYTNDRLAYYYDYNSSVVDGFNNTMFYFYWILTGISIFLFLYKKQFHNASYYPFIILIIVAPFITHKFYELTFSKIKHASINNLFFIFFIVIVSLFFVFNFLSKLPFNKVLQPE